jgi:hypothetical protein
MSNESTQGNELASAADDLAEAGMVDAAIGAEELDEAADAAAFARGATAAAASDLTRSVDAGVVADRLGALSDMVGTAGINDISQGVDMLTASDDVSAMSAVVGMMSLGDLDRGLELSRLAGELSTIAEVVSALEMPVLATVLDNRGDQLQEIAVDVILRAGAERGLASLMAATGKQIADLGEGEIDEGMLRMAASDIAAERSGELATASTILGVRGAMESAAADAAADLASDLAADGIEDVARGSAKLGAGAVMDAAAEE